MHHYFRLTRYDGKKSLEFIGDDTTVTSIDKADPRVFKAHDIHIPVEQIKEYTKRLDIVCDFIQLNSYCLDREQIKIRDNMWHAVHTIQYEWDAIAQTLEQIESINNYDWT